jgi:molybdopterin-guanine dinucleotide biosynthesis protein A
MGRDKATLPFGPESLLQRVVRLVGEVVDRHNIVIVAASEQRLPQLPPEIRIARDERQNRGPLEGLAAGFRGLGTDVDAAYATSCDVPLLVPAFVSRMFELLGDHEIAVPHDGERFHPLAAVYRPTVLTHIVKLLAADQLRLRYLFDEASTRKVPVDELRSVDTSLSTLENLNAPDDYLNALSAAGFPQLGDMPQEGGLSEVLSPRQSPVRLAPEDMAQEDGLP